MLASSTIPPNIFIPDLKKEKKEEYTNKNRRKQYQIFFF